MDADLIESDLKYNVNPFLIQPCYRYEVVLNDEGVPTITTGEHVFRKDSYWEQCPKAHRVE